MISAERLNELKLAHGTVFELSVPANAETGIRDLVVYCRKPTREEFARFAKEVTSNAASAMTNMLVSCILEPSMTELKPVWDEFPALPFIIGGRLQALIGATTEAAVKKL